MNLAALKRWFRKRLWFRTVIQIFFFVLIALIAVNHSLSEAGTALFPWLSQASLHALCPFGGVVTAYQYVTVGTFIPKIHASAYILMWAGFGLALLFGPVFCGWVCPLGSFQEWLGSIGRRLFRRRYNHFVPYQIDRLLRYLRYVVLAWVVYVTASSATLFFADYDPYYALFNFWSAEIAIGGLLVLAVVIAATLFVERPWCKYACPYGALLGLFNLVRIFHIFRREQTCIECRACDRSCPMNIPVSTSSVVRDHQCISCLECTSEAACPVGDTALLTTGRN